MSRAIPGDPPQSSSSWPSSSLSLLLSPVLLKSESLGESSGGGHLTSATALLACPRKTTTIFRTLVRPQVVQLAWISPCACEAAQHGSDTHLPHARRLSVLCLQQLRILKPASHSKAACTDTRAVSPREGEGEVGRFTRHVVTSDCSSCFALFFNTPAFDVCLKSLPL
ncbi:unnamed protein product [Ectocarpus fasciculatus]